MGTVTTAPIRTAVVGFGISGKVFHDGQPGHAAEAARLFIAGELLAGEILTGGKHPMPATFQPGRRAPLRLPGAL